MTALEAVPDPEPEKPTLDLSGISLNFTPTLGEMVAAEKVTGVTSDKFGGAVGMAATVWLALRRAGRPASWDDVLACPVDAVQAAFEVEKDDAGQRPG